MDFDQFKANVLKVADEIANKDNHRQGFDIYTATALRIIESHMMSQQYTRTSGQQKTPL